MGVNVMHKKRNARLKGRVRLWRRIWAARNLYLMFFPVFLYYAFFRYAPMGAW